MENRWDPEFEGMSAVGSTSTCWLSLEFGIMVRDFH